MSKAMETVNTTIHDAAHVIVGAAVNVSWQEILIRLAIALVIVGVGICLVFAGKKLLKALLNRKKAEQEDEGQKKTLLSLLTNLLSFTVYFAAGCMALSALGVNVESILAVAGVGGLAIGFGCQTLVKDFVSGLFLWLEGNLKVGDVVTVGGLTGTVEKMALRTTSLRAANGNLYTIPNGDIRTVVNMTRDFRYALVDIVLAHSQDYQKAMDVMQAAMAQLDEQEEMLEETPKVVGLSGNDRFAATIRIECKCAVEKCWEVERKIRQAALESLKKEGFTL